MMSWRQAKHTNNELSSQHGKIHQQTHYYGKTTYADSNYAVVSKMITIFPLWINQVFFILIIGIHCLFNHMRVFYFLFLIKNRSSQKKQSNTAKTAQEDSEKVQSRIQ